MPTKTPRAIRATSVVAMMALANTPDIAWAESPYQVQWIKQIGTATVDESHAVALDSTGNVYLGGNTQGNIGGVHEGKSDAYVIKYDASGDEVWSTQIGTHAIDYSWSVAVDGDNNTYITGRTDASLGGPNAGGADAFLTKLDPWGTELWSRQIGTASYDEGWSVAVDEVGNAYITGITHGSLAGPRVGTIDAFLTKFDPSGTELWSNQIGAPYQTFSWSVDVDGAGNAYISGYTNGSLGGPSLGNNDAFLMKFDPSGTEVWTQQIGTSRVDLSYAVAVDSAGNTYISGRTNGSLGGPNEGSYDAFLTKFDPWGAELWSRQIGTTEFEQSWSVALDDAGNAYITGRTSSNLGGPNAGGADVYLTKFSPTGVQLWSQQIGTMDIDEGWSVTVHDHNNVYVSGSTTGNLGGPYAGSTDAFLIKFAIPEPTSIAWLAIVAPALIRRTGY